MNKGTKIRTIAFVITVLNQANVSLGIWEFGNETVNLVYKVFSYLLTLAAGAVALYFNNDFTEAACIGTGHTRQLKDEMKPGYIGERFFTDEDGNLLEQEVEDEQ